MRAHWHGHPLVQNTLRNVSPGNGSARMKLALDFDQSGIFSILNLEPCTCQAGQCPG
jgi:hypothetical protein